MTHIKLKLSMSFGSMNQPLSSEVVLLIKSSCLAAALGLANFITVIAIVVLLGSHWMFNKLASEAVLLKI